MRVLGADFSSSPSRQSPICIAVSKLTDGVLVVESIDRVAAFAEFEACLVAPGPWIMGCDFPFGVPRRFASELNWPEAWPELAATLGKLSVAGFAHAVDGYKARQPAGQKYLKRRIDALAKGASPMNCVNPPVGKMLAAGIPRLLASGVSVPGLLAGDPERVVVEAYPAIVARRAVAGGSYKGKRRTSGAAALVDARRTIITYLKGADCAAVYGFSVRLPEAVEAAVLADGGGDELDAVLCAVQAAWAFTQREHDYGMPQAVDPVEGWIVDPSTEERAPHNESSVESGYNFAYLDEQTKRMIRRAILKAVAIPGYQVPFASRDMPLPYGWGTGGIQVTAACIGPDDILKIIDQGADDTTNAISIRRFFQRMTGVRTTEATTEASLIQSRHRIPETRLTEGQILVLQVPIPEPLRYLEPRETVTRTLHAHADYGLMHVKLYEDIARMGRITTSYDYPVMVAERYLMAPTPTPKFDNPKMHRMPALQLFGAGREKRIYAVPPYTDVVSLDFDDHPFAVQAWDVPCGLCGAVGTYLDEVVIDDAGGRLFCCSDTDFCGQRRARGHKGAQLGTLDGYPDAAE